MSWPDIVRAVGKSRAKLGVELPPDVVLPGHDAQVAVQALHLELGKQKPVGIVAHLRSLLEVEATALDAVAEHLARTWIDGERDSDARWLVQAAGAIGGPRTASLLGGFMHERLRDNTAHHQVTAVAEALWRMPGLLGAHELLMLADMPSRYAKRREDARALFREVAKREKLSPQALALRCAPHDADPAWRARVVALWARYCERMMVDGTRIPLADWRAHVLAHPIRGPMTSRLVLLSGSTEFRSLDGALVDAAGKPVSLDDNAPVGVAHPAELQASWSIAAQPFLQLARTVRRLTASQAATNTIRDLRFFRRDWLHEHGWEARKVDSDWLGDADGFAIRMARDNREIVCRLAGDDTIRSIDIASGAFGSLSPVCQSELLYAFLGQDAGSSAYPYAEMSPSNRATCLQCGKRIDKGVVRVVVERQIDTEAFRGTGPGYVHAGCIAAYLPDMPDRDARIAASSSITWP